MRTIFTITILFLSISFISCEKDNLNENQINENPIIIDELGVSNDVFLSDKEEEPDPDDRD
ncbi:hypothetical protein [Aquimarina rhabdastrellae]